ncbi:MAG: folylpolyglutamate synthase/dihydrofolate synthase family protein [Paludibacteraceae bacterium]|nr:folylpolyglutamate synthase/dihydrofolate synthase family protein [Paludibacteraceae bacterium]
MNYQETLQYLYVKTPAFQQVGQSAYKPGLDNVIALSKAYNHPHTAFKTIHVAGTNGKGSVSHTLAAILQSAGYKVGLYTSPHLRDFSERIRVNGTPISSQYVVQFVEQSKAIIESLNPSFFEITTLMAFSYFKEQAVDIAIIEVGLGGRLDSTNIITPILSVITNVSFDHVSLLGNTLEKIAHEKAGIIKPGVPVVVGEASQNLRPIYVEKGSPVVFAEDDAPSELPFQLLGDCQQFNKKTILAAVRLLQEKMPISSQAVENGLMHVVELTGLQGRWQKLGQNPLIIADTGHNEAGIKLIVGQLNRLLCKTLRMVIGVVNDKDVNAMLSLLPKQAVYYFTNAQIPRALPAAELQELAKSYDLIGKNYPTVQEALQAAKNEASEQDVIFVGGSNFIVAEVV